MIKAIDHLIRTGLYTADMMNALVYRSFSGPIRVERVPLPTLPSADGIILRVRACGVCRSDWHGWKGHDGDIKDHGLPFTPGHELAGEVAEVGASVRRFRVGDRVAVPFILSCGSCRECDRARPTICLRQEQPGFTFRGGMAECVGIPRADRNLSLLPDSIPFSTAAALGCRFTTAYRAVVQQGGLGGAQSDMHMQRKHGDSQTEEQQRQQRGGGGAWPCLGRAVWVCRRWRSV